MDFVILQPDQLRDIIKGYRKEKNLSQNDMAAKLSMKQQSYQEIESNPKKVSFERILEILTVLEVKLHCRQSSEEFNTLTTEKYNITADMTRTSIRSQGPSKPVSTSEKDDW